MYNTVQKTAQTVKRRAGWLIPVAPTCPNLANSRDPRPPVATPLCGAPLPRSVSDFEFRAWDFPRERVVGASSVAIAPWPLPIIPPFHPSSLPCSLFRASSFPRDGLTADSYPHSPRSGRFRALPLSQRGIEGDFVTPAQRAAPHSERPPFQSSLRPVSSFELRAWDFPPERVVGAASAAIPIAPPIIPPFHHSSLPCSLFRASDFRPMELPCFDGHVGVDYGEEEDPT